MPKKLSIFRMLNDFKNELVKYAQQGAPNVDAEAYKERLHTCNRCPHLQKERCGLCGCIVEQKAKWATADCPDNRWDQYEGESNNSKNS